MNTKQTASQLRLAADIIETGHPWEWRSQVLNRDWLRTNAFKSPLQAIADGFEIRLTLATPPDNRPLR